MTAKSTEPAPAPVQEREDTDESLRVERERTDGKLEERREKNAEVVEAVLETARDKAAEVLDVARAQADRILKAEGAPQGAHDRVSEERARDDHALERERAASDQQLTEQIAVGERAIEDHLERERAITDEHLRLERARADRAVTNRDDFLAMVSHDVRTLLTVLAMEATILRQSAALADAGKRSLRSADTIARLTRRMDRLVGDLIDVVAIDAGKLAVTLRSDDASRLGREALDVFAPAAAARHITLRAESTGGPLWATFDRERILQVLSNVVGNATRFTPEGGSITVQTGVVGDDVLFTVADTGSGIPKDELTLIFERFWQAAQDTPRGLGLGLYICRCLVEAHGGRIWAESKPGAGSTVRFTVPRAPVAPRS